MTTALTDSAATELGRALRFIRHAKNMTLRDVAKRASLSPQYVQNLGLMVDNPETLRAAADYLERSS